MIGRRELVGAGLAGMFAAGPFRATAQGTGSVIANPFEVADGRVVIAAKIGTSGPYRFAFDTGGQFSIIDGELARKLKLRTVASQTLTSVGGRHDGAWYRVEDLILAAGRLPATTFIGLDRGLGRERGISGSIGAGLFTSLDTDLDFGKSELRIYPGGRPDRAGWTKLQSRFILGGTRPPLIAVTTEIDGYRADLVADTGTSGYVTLDAAASKASGLWNDGRPYAPTAVRGIGSGLARRRIVRAGVVKVGPFTFERPLVALSPPSTGEDYIFTGMVGLGILSQMNLSSDVSAKALWAQPSGASHPTRVNYALSGLWLIERDGRVVVDDIGTGSPAKSAGVVVGDVVPDMSLAKAIATITGRQGQEVVLAMERGGVPREVKFVLAEYI